MAIAYKSAGAGVSTETSGAALSPACPATVDANDILIIQTAWEGTTSAPNTPTGFALLYGPQNVGTANVARHWVFGKIADGTEDGATNALGAPAVTTQRAARCFSFSGFVSGTITDLVPAASFTNTVGDTDPTGPTVTTTMAGALACALVYQNDNNTLETLAGASDTWTERGTVGGYIFALAPGGVLDLLTATPSPDPDTVSGGAMTVTNDPWGVIGFEIRPSVPSNSIEVLPGFGALVLAGFAAIISISDNQNVLPGFGELSFAGFAPTITASENITISPGLGELSLTGFAPTVTAIATSNDFTPGITRASTLTADKVTPGGGYLS